MPLEEQRIEPGAAMLKPYETLIEQDGFVANTPNAFLSSFKALCSEPSIKAVSFDFFDTIVWRPVRRPVDLFWGLGEKLQAAGILPVDFTPVKFAESRVVAEQKARQRKIRGGQFHEVTLAEIYGEFLGLSDAQQAQAAAQEIAHEAAMTFADPIMREALAFAKAAGKEVLIVSNTYLSREGIAALAAGKTPFEIPLENIHVSCEYGIDKEVGLLQLVLNERGLKPAEVLHIGDNRWADIDISTRAGIASLFYPKFSDLFADFEAREAQVQGFDSRAQAPEIDLLPQLRRQILNMRGDGETLSTSERIGAFVVGPALAAYAHWLLAELDHQGAAPVLCLTREGLFLSEVFQSVAAKTDRPALVSLPFLSSRSIVFSCSFFDFSEAELEAFLLSRRTPFTIRTFCELVGLKQIDPAGFGVPPEHLDFPLLPGAELTPVLIAALQNHAALKEICLAFSEQNRQAFKRYVDAAFERHGVDSSGGVIYVADVGWSGRSQRLMKRVLQAIGHDVELRGLYMATDHASRVEHMLGLRAKGWLYDGGAPHRAALLGLQSKEIIEQVCSSQLGAVRTYDAAGDPVFGRETKSLRQCNELRQLRNAARHSIDQFASFLAEVEPKGLAPALLSPAGFRDAYAGLLTFPSDAEYALFSTWEHEENNLSDNVEMLGSPYQKLFARYATPQQFLETHAYWKLPEFRHARPQLADSMLLKQAQLPSCVQEDSYGFSVTIDQFGALTRKERTAYFSQDGRGVLSAVHFCQGGSRFRFRNDGGQVLEVDAVLISAHDTRSRDRLETVFEPDFSRFPALQGSNRHVPPGAEFIVQIENPALYAAPVSVILCTRRL